MGNRGDIGLPHKLRRFGGRMTIGGISLNDETGGFLCGPVAVVGELEDFGAYFLNF
jgi:hypothetical protein